MAYVRRNRRQPSSLSLAHYLGIVLSVTTYKMAARSQQTIEYFLRNSTQAERKREVY